MEKDNEVKIKYIHLKESDIKAMSKDIPSISYFIAELVDRNDFEMFKANKHKLSRILYEHDKYVRKQVCDEIRCKLIEENYAELRDYQGVKYAWFNLPAFSEVLDQIEKGSEENE